MSELLSIAHYRVTSKLGEGGMGEVFRALDTKLGREVAIKVLPAGFASDPERMARFTREAQVLASLNHPNIAQIYGIEENAIVMELVDGQTLQGPLPIETVINFARQIAEALEAAHEKGITHRDLKPANIKITPQGVVKVLDFGLAKVAERGTTAGSASPMSSPTLTFHSTEAGMIMGTAAYMAPEQAAGKPVDKRADIWAFGVVLWEMLTGNRLFDGETVSHTLADVLRAEFDFGKLPAETPPSIRYLLRRCLDRDVRKRLRDIGEARVILENHRDSAFIGVEKTVAAPLARPWLPWAVTGIVLAAAATLAFVHLRERPAEPVLIRTFIPPPPKTTFNTAGILGTVGPVALSPDGRRMTFSATDANGKNQLWVRGLDALTAQPLAGTEDAIHPFWSPDSKFIAFFTEGKLKKMDASGGTPITLCDAVSGRGGTWNSDGVIVFAPFVGAGLPLHRVSASGGSASPLAIELPSRWPWFLPDGRHFLFSAGATVRVGSLDSKESKVVIESLSDAVYSQNHIIYLRDDTLMAQPFDLQRLATSGEPVPIAENIRSIGAQRRGVFSVSQNGMLVYESGSGSGAVALTWFDRAGKRLGTVGEPGDLNGVYLSPDGKSVVTAVLDPQSHTFDLWRYDVARALRTRLTFENARMYPSAAWSPDGTSIVFNSHKERMDGLYRIASNLSGSQELLYQGQILQYPASWSPDGKFILFTVVPGGLFALPMNGERKPFSPFQNARNSRWGQFSPDGHWIAYASADSQRTEINLAPFPGPGGTLQISTGGGTQPRWRRDGKEIFYFAPDGRLMAVEVSVNRGTLEPGRTRTLFKGASSQGRVLQYDVAPDGQRFVAIVPSEQAGPEPLTLVQNWTAGLHR